MVLKEQRMIQAEQKLILKKIEGQQMLETTIDGKKIEIKF